MFEVVTYKDRRGKDEIGEFILDLDKKAQTNKDARINLAKIREYIVTLKKYGTAIGPPEIKRIRGSKDLWELRPLKNRIFFAYWKENIFVLLHHFTKKSGKTPAYEIERAEKALKDWLESIPVISRYRV